MEYNIIRKHSMDTRPTIQDTYATEVEARAHLNRWDNEMAGCQDLRPIRHVPSVDGQIAYTILDNVHVVHWIEQSA